MPEYYCMDPARVAIKFKQDMYLKEIQEKRLLHKLESEENNQRDGWYKDVLEIGNDVVFLIKHHRQISLFKYNRIQIYK